MESPRVAKDNMIHLFGEEPAQWEQGVSQKMVNKMWFPIWQLYFTE